MKWINTCVSDYWGDEGQSNTCVQSDYWGDDTECLILERSMIRHNIVICKVWIAPSRQLQRGPEHRPLAL